MLTDDEIRALLAADEQTPAGIGLQVGKWTARNALRPLCDEVLRLRVLAANSAEWRAQRDAAREDNAALRGRLNALVEEAVNASELIDDLLAYALQHWEWKYGDQWRLDACAFRQAIAAAKEPPKPQGGDSQ